MEAAVIGRWLLFLSSYSPLLTLTAIRLDAGRFRDLTLSLAVAGVLALALALHAARFVEPRDRVVVHVEDRGSEVAGYLTTYLLPFLTVADPRSADIAAYAGFLLLVGVVYTRSSLLAVNPLLYLLGYQLVFLRSESEQRLLYICRTRPNEADVIRVRPLLREFGIGIQA
jgi:hypothetical protein